jgi:PTH2 family peptidyl-tRNA hydrolase
MSDDFKYKQVIVVRSDLKMSKGKVAAQVGHAAVSAAEVSRKKHTFWWRRWLEEGQCKIILKVENEEELAKLAKQANELGLPYVLIQDKGLTELPPNTTTCIGIGPAPSNLIDKITGNLSLL